MSLVERMQNRCILTLYFGWCDVNIMAATRQSVLLLVKLLPMYHKHIGFGLPKWLMFLLVEVNQHCQLAGRKINSLSRFPVRSKPLHNNY